MEFDLENPLPISDELHSDGLTSLFHAESDHMPPEPYRRSLLASDSDVTRRLEIISMILRICPDVGSSSLSYLAINYLDRFLSTRILKEQKPWIPRLVAVSCVSLALKLREAVFYPQDIQQDGGIVFDAETIERMEYLILGALKWRMRSITPFAFIGFFVSLFQFKDPPLLRALKARATEIVLESQHEFKLMEFKPSLVAASSLLSAAHELFPLQFQRFKQEILNCSDVNKEEFCRCYSVIQEMVMDGYELVMDEGRSGPGAGSGSRSSSTSTAVNVLEQQWSSGSDDSGGDDKTDGQEVPERDSKRRKVDSSFGSDNLFQLSQIRQCLR